MRQKLKMKCESLERGKPKNGMWKWFAGDIEAATNE